MQLIKKKKIENIIIVFKILLKPQFYYYFQVSRKQFIFQSIIYRYTYMYVFSTCIVHNTVMPTYNTLFFLVAQLNLNQRSE